MSAIQERLTHGLTLPRTERVFLPPFPYSPTSLQRQGYRSVGIDVIIGHQNSATNEPIFLFEECKATEKTFEGQLAHPKETMKRDQNWHIESFDEAIRRCMRQELGVSIDDIPLFADQSKVMLETNTYVIKKGERYNYKAFVFVFWDISDFGWQPIEVDTDEVKGVKQVSLSEIIDGNGTQFRECTQDIFTLLQEQGYFSPDLGYQSRIQLQERGRSSRINGFQNIDLTQLPHAF